MISIARLTAFSPLMLSILRIMSGLLFLEHGTTKLLGFPASDYAPAFLTLSWFAGVIELFCGLLLTLGLFTRPTAFLASGMCAFAYFIAHAPKNFFPMNNGGDAAILYCFLFLYIVFAGPGPLSLDGSRKKA